MTESFLHYIWQFQYFTRQALTTATGEVLQIFQPGYRNAHSGPDFSDAKIKIDGLEWRGSVEIHIKASGWNDHHHSADEAYEKVILHVVWENDKPIQRTDGSLMPTVELKDKVDPSLWYRYKNLFASVESIPCAASWPKVSDITKLSMMDRAVVQRLESKATSVKELLVQNNNDWEETCYQLLCKNFGFKVNAEPLFQLAKVLPYKILLKHATPSQTEALLLGQAGFLEKANDDDYIVILKREYHVLRKKYSLDSKQMSEVQWRFLRLRPANFPTIRLVQLAALLSSQKNLFSRIIECSSYKSMVVLLDIEQTEYWKIHYHPGKKSKTAVAALGISSIQNIIINTVAPVLAAYSQLHDDQVYMDRAIDFLQQIPAENNKIIREWATLGYTIRSAFESQGLIELYNNFCMKRRCLECNIGSAIIQS